MKTAMHIASDAKKASQKPWATILLCCFLCFPMNLALFAQSNSKGFKALEAQDWTAAWKNYEAVVAENSMDIAANFGLSRLHGITAAGKRDNEKALEYLGIAESGWSKSTPKEKEKLAKLGLSNAELETRRDRIEASFLKKAHEEGTVDAYSAFMARFPASKSVRSATNYRTAKAYELVQADGSVPAFDIFIRDYAESDEAKKATVTRNEMAAKTALATATEESLSHFIKLYPEAPQAPGIEQRLYAVAFQNAKTANTASAFKSYIERYPKSIFIAQAQDKLDWLSR